METLFMIFVGFIIIVLISLKISEILDQRKPKKTLKEETLLLQAPELNNDEISNVTNDTIEGSFTVLESHSEISDPEKLKYELTEFITGLKLYIEIRTFQEFKEKKERLVSEMRKKALYIFLMQNQEYKNIPNSSKTLSFITIFEKNFNPFKTYAINLKGSERVICIDSLLEDDSFENIIMILNLLLKENIYLYKIPDGDKSSKVYSTHLLELPTIFKNSDELHIFRVRTQNIPLPYGVYVLGKIKRSFSILVSEKNEKEFNLQRFNYANIAGCEVFPIKEATLEEKSKIKKFSNNVTQTMTNLVKVSEGLFKEIYPKENTQLTEDLIKEIFNPNIVMVYVFKTKTNKMSFGDTIFQIPTEMLRKVIHGEMQAHCILKILNVPTENDILPIGVYIICERIIRQ